MHAGHLLCSTRLLPLFVTQFLGAFNDNVFKTAIVILITYRLATTGGSDATLLIIVAQGLFILPFFLFSYIAGQLADKLEKARLIRYVKLLELGIMLLGGVGFWWGSVPFLMLVLFLMGAQSTLFGPLKYGILPQHLATDELIAGNGLIQMGTFIAILLGVSTGGLLAGDGVGAVAALVVVVAAAGWLASRWIPVGPAPDPALVLRWNPWRETARILTYAREQRAVFIAILAISWFWYVGATFISVMPAYAKDVLGGDPSVATLLLTLFSVGIGIGALSCNRLTRGRVVLSLVPFGAAGMSLFCLDVGYLAHPGGGAVLQGVAGFLAHPEHWRVLLGFLAIAFFGGLYIVPLNSYVQHHSAPARRSRIIAAANVLNALFMVISALVTSALVALGWRLPAIFALLGWLNLLVLGWLLVVLPAARFRPPRGATAGD